MKILPSISRQIAVLAVSCSFFACTKSQEELYPKNNIIEINIKGYIAKDSLQFKLGETVVKPNLTEPGSYFQGNVDLVQLSNGATKFSILNGKGEQLLEKNIDGANVTNKVTFYYNGVSIVDKLPEMPAVTPGNVGVLVSFPERTFSKVPISDIALEVTLQRRGKPTITKLYAFNEDATAFIDLEVASYYPYISFKLVKADNPKERYLPNGLTANFTLNAPQADKKYAMQVQEAVDGFGNFYGVEAVEISQYLE
ncbi:hypothetical protein [Chitinophaga nivalis]|uniref:DUF3823 domain-containing protein n=1 Tax=Chitinophaga nivalis TaxID=2991709 RepID=A0ABT3IME5_9BACT|nr:hypothetical protein [Chitinophaga nivalis]MCW3465159.1 hypothetical protein [Chitinophaga nivalis]MCW3485149.1 hypothetical protein [Chitinophaga nivalis]